MILVFMRPVEMVRLCIPRGASGSFVNMLLRKDETRSSRDLESTSQLELVTLCSLLNQEEKLGEYGLTTEENIKKYHQSQQKRRKGEGASNTVTVEDAMAMNNGLPKMALLLRRKMQQNIW